MRRRAAMAIIITLMLYASLFSSPSGYVGCYTANSSNYTIGSFHSGSVGGAGNSTDYNSRFTGTYQQPGNPNATNNVTANIGWFYLSYVTVNGRVFEDLGELGAPFNPNEDRGIPNVIVALFKDSNGNGVLDANDTLIATTTTSITGEYSFTIFSSDTYFIAVNSKTVNTTRGLNEGYTLGDIWAEQTFQVSWNGTAYENQTKFGGQNPTVSDNWDNGIYEHYAVINPLTYRGENIDFGFSFDIVVNTNDDGQGSLRQFMINANAIKGSDKSEFRIPESDPNYSNGIFTITLSSNLPTIDDPNTSIDASTQPIGKIRVSGNGYAVFTTKVENTSILNLEIANFSTGIKANETGSDGLRIENVIFSGTGGTAVYLEDTYWDFQKYKAVISNVTINGTFYYGINMTNRVWVEIKDTYIRTNGTGLYWANWAGNSANVTITNITFENNDRGIYFYSTTNMAIIQESKFENNTIGILLELSNDTKILNSQFISNKAGGIETHGSLVNITIFNNTFYNNGYEDVDGYYSYSGIGMVISSRDEVYNVIIDSNKFENNGYANVSNMGFGIYIWSNSQSAFNFTITNNFVNASWRDGIFIRGVSNLRIENNTITSNGQVRGDPAGSGIRIVGYNSSNVYIANNNITGNQGNGISLEGLEGNYLRNVTVYNNTILYNGIDENDGNAIFIGGRVENVLVVNNTMKYSDAQAILIQEPYGWNGADWIGTNITIKNNLIAENGLTIHAGQTTAAITIGAYGDYYQGPGYITISNNLIVNNSICPNPTYQGKMGGIEIYGMNQSTRIIVQGNIISNCSTYGIIVAASKDVLIENNTITGCEVGVAVPSYDLIPYNITITKNSIYNNTYLGIDLGYDNVTLNDGALSESQPNYGIDYPVITYATFNGTHLYVEGFIGNESVGGSSEFANAVVEIYLVKNTTNGDNLMGNNVTSTGQELNRYYGEGWIYLGTLMANTSGYFSGMIYVEGKGVTWNSLLTATATLSGKGTSEFGPDYELISYHNVVVTLSIKFVNGKFNVTISVTAYDKPQFGIRVYWILPSGASIESMSGDYDDNETVNGIYYWYFNIIRPGETKHIYLILSGNFSLSEACIVGVDPR